MIYSKNELALGVNQKENDSDINFSDNEMSIDRSGFESKLCMEYDGAGSVVVPDSY